MKKILTNLLKDIETKIANPEDIKQLLKNKYSDNLISIKVEKDMINYEIYTENYYFKNSNGIVLSIRLGNCLNYGTNISIQSVFAEDNNIIPIFIENKKQSLNIENIIQKLCNISVETTDFENIRDPYIVLTISQENLDNPLLRNKALLYSYIMLDINAGLGIPINDNSIFHDEWETENNMYKMIKNFQHNNPDLFKEMIILFDHCTDYLNHRYEEATQALYIIDHQDQYRHVLDLKKEIDHKKDKIGYYLFKEDISNYDEEDISKITNMKNEKVSEIRSAIQSLNDHIEQLTHQLKYPYKFFTKDHYDSSEFKIEIDTPHESLKALVEDKEYYKEQQTYFQKLITLSHKNLDKQSEMNMELLDEITTLNLSCGGKQTDFYCQCITPEYSIYCSENDDIAILDRCSKTILNDGTLYNELISKIDKSETPILFGSIPKISKQEEPSLSPINFDQYLS